jgi:hypothetical protein
MQEKKEKTRIEILVENGYKRLDNYYKMKIKKSKYSRESEYQNVCIISKNFKN